MPLCTKEEKRQTHKRERDTRIEESREQRDIYTSTQKSRAERHIPSKQRNIHTAKFIKEQSDIHTEERAERHEHTEQRRTCTAEQRDSRSEHMTHMRMPGAWYMHIAPLTCSQVSFISSASGYASPALPATEVGIADDDLSWPSSHRSSHRCIIHRHDRESLRRGTCSCLAPGRP